MEVDTRHVVHPATGVRLLEVRVRSGNQRRLYWIDPARGSLRVVAAGGDGGHGGIGGLGSREGRQGEGGDGGPGGQIAMRVSPSAAADTLRAVHAFAPGGRGGRSGAAGRRGRADYVLPRSDIGSLGSGVGAGPRSWFGRDGVDGAPGEIEVEIAEPAIDRSSAAAPGALAD